MDIAWRVLATIPFALISPWAFLMWPGKPPMMGPALAILIGLGLFIIWGSYAARR